MTWALVLGLLAAVALALFLGLVVPVLLWDGGHPFLGGAWFILGATAFIAFCGSRE